MKRYNLLILCLFFSIIGNAKLYDSPAFRIMDESAYDISFSWQNKSISSDTSFIMREKSSISGLAISGKISLITKESLVRILLIDDENREYLVFEQFYMFPEDTTLFFSKVAMETAMLENIIPLEIKMYIDNATVELSQLTAVPAKNISPKEFSDSKKNIFTAQEEYLINRWNKLNAETHQYWLAGATSISKLSYTDRKKALGATSNHYISDGFEYYIGGIFVVKSHTDTSEGVLLDAIPNSRDEQSLYVESFDWRNRHGKNWMTSVKNQNLPANSAGGGGCWIFGPIAALESHINLYYNRLLNLDLSEQDVGSCHSTSGTIENGGWPNETYYYIQQNGIVSESCFPFGNSDTIPCDNKCAAPDYVVNISTYSSINSSENVLKHELINNGPIASGISTPNRSHVMCLCGYWTVQAGDHIEIALQYSAPFAYIDTIIPANSDLIGKTCWIYKNSSGISDANSGYVYAVFENDASRAYTTKISYPVSISTLTSDDIVCKDADNDGYYFWGLGPKPNNCPVCCPDTPDGDDSNPQLAEMDEYGNFVTYNFPYPTLTLNSDTLWNMNQTQCGNIIVTNNSTLTISAELTMNPAAKIVIESGSSLIVDAGTIVNASITVQPSAKLILQHNGTLYLRQYGNLSIPLGAEANLDYGKILLQ